MSNLAQPAAHAADHLAMMTLNKARRLALESLAGLSSHRHVRRGPLSGRPSEDLLLIDERTQCRRTGWIFFYESRACLENGEVAQAVGGTGPVVVTHAGEVHHLAGGRPVEEVLRDFEVAHRRRLMPH